MTRGFMLGVAAALLFFAGWAFGSTWRGALCERQNQQREIDCRKRIEEAVDLARDGYVLPVPVDAPSEPIRSDPVKQHRRPTRHSETAKPGPPPGGAISPEPAPSGVDPRIVAPARDDWADNPLCCRAIPGTGDVRCDCDQREGTDPSVFVLPDSDCSALGKGTCDVDVRAGMVRARATCDGLSIPCRVTGAETPNPEPVSYPATQVLRLDLAVGVSTDLHGLAGSELLFGATRKRFGVYVGKEWLPGSRNDRYHAGIRVLLR